MAPYLESLLVTLFNEWQIEQDIVLTKIVEQEGNTTMLIMYTPLIEALRSQALCYQCQ